MLITLQITREIPDQHPHQVDQLMDSEDLLNYFDEDWVEKRIILEKTIH